MDLDFTHPVHCYNGAFDSRSSQVLKNREDAFQRLKKACPAFHITYFPMEDMYQAYDNFTAITDMCATYGACLQVAADRLGVALS